MLIVIVIINVIIIIIRVEKKIQKKKKTRSNESRDEKKINFIFSLFINFCNFVNCKLAYHILVLLSQSFKHVYDEQKNFEIIIAYIFLKQRPFEPRSISYF